MKIKNWILLLLGAIVIFSSCGQTTNRNIKFENEIDTLSYAIGTDIAKSFKRNSLEEINYDNLIQGIIDNFEEKELKIDEEELVSFMKTYFRKVQERKLKENEEKAIKNLEEGHTFLEENKKKEGVITTESGLEYEIIKEGTGKSPKLTDIVKCHYHGTLIDGTVFDSSVERGDTAQFQLNKVIDGWKEGIQLMKEGAKYKFYIPTELAYGKNVRPGGKVEPNSVLIFEVELFEVIPQEDNNK